MTEQRPDDSAAWDFELHAQMEYEAMLEADDQPDTYEPIEGCIGMVNQCECANCQF